MRLRSNCGSAYICSCGAKFLEKVHLRKWLLQNYRVWITNEKKVCAWLPLAIEIISEIKFCHPRNAKKSLP
jgi:hypothetical protein